MPPGPLRGGAGLCRGYGSILWGTTLRQPPPAPRWGWRGGEKRPQSPPGCSTRDAGGDGVIPVAMGWCWQRWAMPAGMGWCQRQWGESSGDRVMPAGMGWCQRRWGDAGRDGAMLAAMGWCWRRSGTNGLSGCSGTAQMEPGLLWVFFTTVYVTEHTPDATAPAPPWSHPAGASGKLLARRSQRCWHGESRGSAPGGKTSPKATPGNGYGWSGRGAGDAPTGRRSSAHWKIKSHPNWQL